MAAAGAATLESFVTASADHQDGCYRLVQYAARLLGSLHVTRRQSLFALSNALDRSRILTRTFGVVYAVRAAMAGHSRLDDLLADLALCAYHPLETWYWLLLVTASPKAERRRTLSRLSSLFGLVWGVLYGANAYKRLRALTADQAAAKPADRVAEGAEGGFSHEISRLRRLVWKLALDSALCFHWALDHHTLKLSDWQVGLIGTASAALGLRLQWGAYVEAIQLQAREEEEENEKAAAEEEGADEALNGVQTPTLSA